MDDKYFCFKNGNYRGPDRIDNGWNHPEHSEMLDSIVVIQSNSGFSEYAIVPIVFNGGGSGYLYYFLLFGIMDTCITQLDYDGIRDSTLYGRFKSMRASGDTVLVEVDDEPHITNKFLIRGNKLIYLNNR